MNFDWGNPNIVNNTPENIWQGTFRYPTYLQKWLLLKFYCIRITNLSFNFFILLKFKLIFMFMTQCFLSGGAPSPPPVRGHPPSPPHFGNLVYHNRYYYYQSMPVRIPTCCCNKYCCWSCHCHLQCFLWLLTWLQFLKTSMLHIALLLVCNLVTTVEVTSLRSTPQNP